MKTPVTSKTIRVDTQVYQHLKRRAQGFEIPNRTLRRLLGLDKSGRRKDTNKRTVPMATDSGG